MQKQKGTGLVSILVCVFIGLLISHFVFTPYMDHRAVNEMRTNVPSVTIADKQLVDSFLAKEAPLTPPIGAYTATGKASRNAYQITYYFDDDGTLTKEMSIAGQLLAGSADYSFQGSVLTYSSIIGDRFMFPEIGEAVTFGDGVIMSHSVDDQLELKPVSQESKGQPSAAAGTHVKEETPRSWISPLTAQIGTYIGIVWGGAVLLLLLLLS